MDAIDRARELLRQLQDDQLNQTGVFAPRPDPDEARHADEYMSRTTPTKEPAPVQNHATIETRMRAYIDAHLRAVADACGDAVGRFVQEAIERERDVARQYVDASCNATLRLAMNAIQELRAEVALLKAQRDEPTGVIEMGKALRIRREAA